MCWEIIGKKENCSSIINFLLVSCILWATNQSSNIQKKKGNIYGSRKQVPVKRSVIELRNVQIGSRHSDVFSSVSWFLTKETWGSIWGKSQMALAVANKKTLTTTSFQALSLRRAFVSYSIKRTVLMIILSLVFSTFSTISLPLIFAVR